MPPTSTPSTAMAACRCGAEDGAGGWRFEIRLEMASRLSAEGDLTIALSGVGTNGASGACLHRLSFSWVDGAFAGIDAPIVPLHRAQPGPPRRRRRCLYRLRTGLPPQLAQLLLLRRPAGHRAGARHRRSRGRQVGLAERLDARRRQAFRERLRRLLGDPGRRADCGPAGGSHCPSTSSPWRRCRPATASARRCGASTGRRSARRPDWRCGGTGTANEKRPASTGLPAVIYHAFSYAAFTSSPACLRCSTKIGCAHCVSFFFLLVMSVRSDGS
jgi:hypothetical protein